MAKPRLAVVVKYYHPMKRISGIIGYLEVLFRQLAQTHDLHVVSYRTRGESVPTISKDSYTIHKVGFPFPACAALKLRRLAPRVVIVVSGINNLKLAAPYFRLLNSLTPGSVNKYFYQTTNVHDGGERSMLRLLQSYRRTFCASQAILNHFLEHGLLKCDLVEPAVDVEYLTSVRPDIKNARLRVGFVNHFNEVKGADIALELFANVARNDIEFVAAGIGELAAQLRMRYQRQQNLTFLGYLDERARLSLIKSCDIMVLPFRTSISVLGISQTVLECMALGVTVIGSDTPAITAAIEPGQDGLAASTPSGYLKCLYALCDDDSLRHRLARSAREKVEARFDVRATCERLSQLIQTEGRE